MNNESKSKQEQEQEQEQEQGEVDDEQLPLYTETDADFPPPYTEPDNTTGSILSSSQDDMEMVHQEGNFSWARLEELVWVQ